LDRDHRLTGADNILGDILGDIAGDIAGDIVGGFNRKMTRMDASVDVLVYMG
jgi:hypothetical protein